MMNIQVSPEIVRLALAVRIQSGAAHPRRRSGGLQPAADAAQNVDDGSSRQSPAVVDVPHEPELHVALQRGFRRRRDEPARAAEYGDSRRGGEHPHHAPADHHPAG